jgi:hypothetical protein
MKYNEKIMENILVYSVANPGCLSRIRIFSIPDPGARIQGQKDS